MKKKFGLASALAVALSFSVAPAALADEGKGADSWKTPKYNLADAQPLPTNLDAGGIGSSPLTAETINQTNTRVNENTAAARTAQSIADSANDTANEAASVAVDAKQQADSNTQNIMNLNNNVVDPDAKGQGSAWDKTARNASSSAQAAANAANATANAAGNAANTAGQIANKAQVSADNAMGVAADARQQADGNTMNIQSLANGASNDSVARNGVSALDQRFSDGMAAGKAYVDQSAANTLNSANAYTDQRYNQLNGSIKKLRS